MGFFVNHRFSTPMLLNSSALNWDRNKSAPAKTMSKITTAAAIMYMAASFLNQYNDFGAKTFHVLTNPLVLFLTVLQIMQVRSNSKVQRVSFGDDFVKHLCWFYKCLGGYWRLV